MPEASAKPFRSVDPRGEFPLDPTSYFFHLFAVVGRHRESRMDEILQPIGLNVARHRGLSAIAILAPCTMSELADFSAVDRTTMTRTVDQLVDAGLVERATPREDRRQVVLTLTDQGRATCDEALRALYRLSRRLLEGVAEDDARVVARVFETVLENLLGDPALLDRLLFREPLDAAQ